MQRTSTVMCFILIAVLPITLIAIIRQIYKIRVARILDPENDSEKEKGFIQEGNLRNNLVGNYWFPLVMIRWTITNLIIILLRDYPQFQITFFLVLSVSFQGIVIGNRLIPDTLNFCMNIFNELAASVYLYLMMALTHFSGDNPYRENIGWSQLVLVCGVVLINVFKTAYQYYPKIKWRLLRAVQKSTSLLRKKFGNSKVVAVKPPLQNQFYTDGFYGQVDLSSH